MSILKGFHKHHIIPKYMGGSDDPANLVTLHPIDHAIAHLVRYKMFGDIRDKWATNWLQNIVDPDVYTKFSIDREKRIKEKRQIDPVFDAYINFVRSKASQNRQEGYQKKAGEEFSKRMKDDSEWAKKISANRKKAKEASKEALNKKNEDRVRMVRQMRKDGCSYKEISEATGFFISVISGIINNKQFIGVGELDYACIS